MIYLCIPNIPPTENHAYITILKRAGKSTIPIRKLSKEGEKYKNETSAYLVRHFPAEMKIFERNKPYGVIGQFGFERLENKGWPDKTENRYKRLDAANRLKLFQDALFDATGIDDCHVISSTAVKVQGEPLTQVWAWNADEENPYAAFFARSVQPH